MARIKNSRETQSSFEKLEYLKSVQKIFDTFEGDNIKRINSNKTIEDIHGILCEDIIKTIEA